MKRLILIIFTVLIVSLNVFLQLSYADQTQTCHWIWSTDVTSANDAPDFVFCTDRAGYTFQSQGTTYIQDTKDADKVYIQYDTTWDNSKQIDGKTPCSNTASTGDLNVLSCTEGVCDTGTTDVAYHQVNDIADAINLGFEMTPPTSGFKLTVDGDTATCWVVRTITHWPF